MSTEDYLPDQAKMDPPKQEGPTKRLPKWTVVCNLNRRERTSWIGQSWEFFNDENMAHACYLRHQDAGDVPTMRPFHHTDEKYLHVLDSRYLEMPKLSKFSQLGGPGPEDQNT